jgi:hypothetical protein
MLRKNRRISITQIFNAKFALRLAVEATSDLPWEQQSMTAEL